MTTSTPAASSSPSLWRLPMLVSVVHRHAPLALPGGRTPLHIVARGRGWLRVDAGGRRCWRCYCGDGFDGVVLVNVAPSWRVTLRSLVGRVVVDVDGTVVLGAAPAPPPGPDLDTRLLSATHRLVVPDLRPPGVRPRIPLG